jgi:hypothetical protein
MQWVGRCVRLAVGVRLGEPECAGEPGATRMHAWHAWMLCRAHRGLGGRAIGAMGQRCRPLGTLAWKYCLPVKRVAHHPFV